MKKLFTLIALAMSFVGGYAQTTLIDFEGGKMDGISVITDDTKNMTLEGSVKINNVSTKGIKVGKSKTVILNDGDHALDAPNQVFVIKPEGGLKKGDEIILSGVIASGKSDKSAQIGFYSFVAGSGDTQGKFSQVAITKALADVKTSDYSIETETFVLEKDYDVLYFGRSGNSTAYVLKFKVLRTASTESLTTAVSSFSTYAASYPVDYSFLGLDAYAITLDEANMKVKYNKIDGVVPANTPVLVKGEASKTYSLTKATTDGVSVTTDLQVSDGTITGDGSTIYAFGTKNGVSGFKVVASGVKIPAKKGYLKLSSSAAAKDFFAFGGETTGISNISANGIDEEETPLFNLAGQRVDKSYKGVVVKNGKKFVNK